MVISRFNFFFCITYIETCLKTSKSTSKSNDQRYVSAINQSKFSLHIQSKRLPLLSQMSSQNHYTPFHKSDIIEVQMMDEKTDLLISRNYPFTEWSGWGGSSVIFFVCLTLTPLYNQNVFSFRLDVIDISLQNYFRLWKTERSSLKDF